MHEGRDSYVDPEHRILVLGVGNSILKDEGFGIHVVEELQRRRAELKIPETVDIIDGATLGISLLYYIEGRDKIILLDVVNANADPGDIFRFTSQEIKTKQVTYKVSMHQVTLFDVLTMAELTGRMAPEAVVIAVQPGVIDWGEELTPEVKAAVPKVIDMVLKELETTAIA
jgi:hydrogenase maturation protease